MKQSTAILFSILLPFGTGNAESQSASNPNDDTQVMKERIKKLEEDMQILKTAQAPPVYEPRNVNIGGAGSSAAKAMNPDISLIGDFHGVAGHNQVNPSPALEMHEAEVGIQAVVDPYCRGDVFLSFGTNSVSVEEAYLTFTSLPWNFVAKAGQMRAVFGKVNPQHTHTLTWVDRPLVIQNLVNGEDGIDDMGVSVTHLIPAPGNFFLEATAQVYKGNSDNIPNGQYLFESHQNNDLLFVGHLRGYQDLTENTNLELGYSYAQGHNELGHEFLTKLNGVDLSLRWKPLRRSIYTSLTWRTEAVWSNRQQLPLSQHAFGLYSSLDYRIDERWTVGGRYDYSQRALDATKLDRGGSLILTYWMSEFAQLRSHYRYTRYAEKINASELLFQVCFVMGAHGAHPF